MMLGESGTFNLFNNLGNSSRWILIRIVFISILSLCRFCLPAYNIISAGIICCGMVLIPTTHPAWAYGIYMYRTHVFSTISFPVYSLFALHWYLSLLDLYPASYYATTTLSVESVTVNVEQNLLDQGHLHSFLLKHSNLFFRITCCFNYDYCFLESNSYNEGWNRYRISHWINKDHFIYLNIYPTKLVSHKCELRPWILNPNID